MLEQIRNTHPLVYRNFSALADGERHLRSVMAIDRYWENLDLPVPEVIRDGSRLPASTRIGEEFDIVYAGGTLGLLHAAVMANRYGRKVLVIDRAEPGRTTHDWNISRRELLRLADTGVFRQAELDSTIVRRYKTGWVEFHAPADAGGAALHDCGDVLAQGRIHRENSDGCGSHRHSAAALFRDHVPRVVLAVQKDRRGLPEIGHALLHGGKQQLRAGHCGRGRGVWHQLRRSLRRRHRHAGRSAGARQPGEHLAVGQVKMVRCG